MQTGNVSSTSVARSPHTTTAVSHAAIQCHSTSVVAVTARCVAPNVTSAVYSSSASIATTRQTPSSYVSFAVASYRVWSYTPQELNFIKNNNSFHTSTIPLLLLKLPLFIIIHPFFYPHSKSYLMRVTSRTFSFLPF